MTDGDRYQIRPVERVEGAMKWLRNHGYIGSFIPAAPQSFAHDVILFGRPGEVPIMATAGTTLVWDGHTITVGTT